MNKLRCLIFCLCICTLTGSAQQNTNLYYLCIGSQHYTIDFDKYAPGFTGLPNLEAASVSAHKMAKLFDDFGAVNGKVLTSSSTNFITKQNLFEATEDLIKLVKKEKTKNPFVIIYYGGHGFSSPVFEGHYIPPGDFVQNPDSLGLEEWMDFGIAPLDIHEKLQQAKINHMILLDCCYDGKQNPSKLPDPYVAKGLGLTQVGDLMESTYTIFKAMNRMVGPDPVIFSTTVDSSVVIVPFPVNETEMVGPLCRKSYLIKNNTINKKLSVKEFTLMMLDKQLDKVTKPGVSFVSFDKQNEDYLKIK